MMSRAPIASILPASDQTFLAQIRALRSPEVTATHPGPPRLPNHKSISEHFARIVDSWTPHVFTPEETRTVRLEGLRYLVIVAQIEEVQRDIYPRPLPVEVQAQLVFARQSYMLRYFRTFRMNDLPTEIICNILRYVVWDQMKRPVDARLRVTWTCRRWREIALADSTLWNAVWFRGTGAQIERAWAWFDRARMAPLDIRIDDHCPEPDSDDEDDDCVDTTIQSSMSGPDMLQLLLRLFTKLSTIRMLIIVVDEWPSALMVLDMLRASGPSGMPLLTRFELHRGGGDKKEDRMSFTWPEVVSQPFLDWSNSILQNLTTFDMRRLPSTHSPDAARFREILANCHRLQKLSMDGAGPQYEEQDQSHIVPVQLPHLRTLVIADFTRKYAMFLFSQFSAPNVNDLTLMNLCGDNYLPLFIQLTSGFPKVRLLTTYSIQFDATLAGLQTMTRWLDSMPLLTYLRVANVAPQFLGTFFRPRPRNGPPPHPVAPVSPHLAVADCQSIAPDMLVQWATDRHKFGTPLRKIYISEELGARLDPEQIKTLTSICTLAKLPRGATTPEEEALSL
ncbi:hypothetical protein B0H10DRAFT_1022772 [Mycena sp. CBHHK59/15]|nr:hypothetical protein B0H10DRAFT_1022772 [Mycena sp. CBHHK59/15]